jgi:hypothetical protein
MVICRRNVYGVGQVRLDMSQGLGLLLSKGKAITWLRSLIRVESCGLVRNGGRGQVIDKGGELWISEEWGPRSGPVTLRENEQSITHIT